MSDKTSRVLKQLQPQERRTAVGTDMFLPNHSGVESYVNKRAIFEHLKITAETSQHALNVSQSQTSGDNITALNINSNNIDSSAMWLTGTENDRGTLKITHNYPSVSDANAAAISIKLANAASAARAIFIDTDGSTGDFISARNNTTEKFVVESTGNVICTSIAPDNGASGSFTTVDGKTVTVTNGIITSIV